VSSISRFIDAIGMPTDTGYGECASVEFVDENAQGERANGGCGSLEGALREGSNSEFATENHCESSGG